MNWQTYPYDGWVITPAFVIKKLTFTRQSWSNYDRPAEAGAKAYHRESEIFQTKADAIEAARRHLDEAQAKLVKSLENLDKKRAKLRKA